MPQGHAHQESWFVLRVVVLQTLPVSLGRKKSLLPYRSRTQVIISETLRWLCQAKRRPQVAGRIEGGAGRAARREESEDGLLAIALRRFKIEIFDVFLKGSFDTAAFSRRLRSVRQQRGWTQRHLGIRADVDEEVISRLERGKQAPSAAVLVGLCRSLDVSADYLLGLREAP